MVVVTSGLLDCGVFFCEWFWYIAQSGWNNEWMPSPNSLTSLQISRCCKWLKLGHSWLFQHNNDPKLNPPRRVIKSNVWLMCHLLRDIYPNISKGNGYIFKLLRILFRVDFFLKHWRSWQKSSVKKSLKYQNYHDIHKESIYIQSRSRYRNVK